MVTLDGGTHNPMAPPFEFLRDTFLPQLKRMGVSVNATLEAYGFYPAGGGSLRFEIEPAQSLTALRLAEKNGVNAVTAKTLLVKLPQEIGNREINVLKTELKRLDRKEVVVVDKGRSAGNVVLVQIETGELLETVTAIGARGVRAEEVAKAAAQETNRYLESPMAVGEHLADQLLVPLALAGSGSFLTSVLSLHTTTNIEVIKQFIDVDITSEQLGDCLWKISVLKRS